jgi:hypothetical protein
MFVKVESGLKWLRIGINMGVVMTVINLYRVSFVREEKILVGGIIS